METGSVLSGSSDPLGRSLALASVRQHGVASEQLRDIATDPEIFEAFYCEHFEAVQGFVARRVNDFERAADLTAEVFLAAIDAAPRYELRRGTPKAWLYGIARTVVAGDRRRSGRERSREERLRASMLLDDDDASQIEARIEAAASQRRLYEAMDRLPDAERAVLELVAIDELKLTEVAAAVGVRPVTARVRLHRARRKLRVELEAASSRATVRGTRTTVSKGEQS